ncbi:MAG: tetraacyldisaccharide 4'-kinase [Planctomycetaceae bacterium]|jgi:tetraacyldisaccharide 4'-kinase|nr:tetraacyldisaccharide 4'-kinase [Planctomycetaceae bacterium]
MWEKWFRQLVSGERRGLWAFFLRLFFWCVSIFYGFVVQVRNFLYDKKILKIHKTNIPIVSVGNLTLGGTGKSPMVAWICEYFIEQGLQPAIISSGYKHNKTKNTNNTTNKTEVNDEYLELAFRLPNVCHFQNRDRVFAVCELLDFVGRSGGVVDIVVLDDGMQHRRLQRDFEIVLLDAMLPFGYGYFFPRGFLRESLRGLRRADVVLLSRADCISEVERQNIAAKVCEISPNAIYAEVIHSPDKIIYYGGVESAADSICGKNILAFCGIGNPNAFYSTLQKKSDGQIHFVQFPDHYSYTKDDFIRIMQDAISLQVDIVICTMKDFVKINQLLNSLPESDLAQQLLTKIPIAALTIQIKFLTNESQFKETLNKKFKV